MKIDKKTIVFLKGKEFSDGYCFSIKDLFYSNTRIEKILELTKDKKILHLGCCDHIPLIEKRIVENKWLHKLLTENCEKVLGIDINKNAIDYVKNKIKFKNVKYLDILNEKKDEDILKNEWDYIVLGEILEHVDNPVEFLEKILKNYGKNIKNILITVPNILSTGRILEIKKNNGEMINSDHRYWFSPYTLLKVTERAGIKIENSNIYFTDLYIFNFFCLKKLYRIIEKLLNKKIFSYKFYDFATLIFIGNIKKNTK